MPAPGPSSLIDRVDDADRVVGQIQRQEALQVGANFRTVHVFVFRKQQVLVQQLAPTRDRHPLRWGSSVAAYLHARESYEDAARRRLDEELGLRLDLQPIGVARMRDERSQKFVGLFVCQISATDEPRIADPEHIAALGFVSLEVLLDLAIKHSPSLTPTLEHLLVRFGDEVSALAQPG